MVVDRRACASGRESQLLAGTRGSAGAYCRKPLVLRFTACNDRRGVSNNRAGSAPESGDGGRRLRVVGGEISARTANGTGGSVRDAYPVGGRWTGMRWIVIVVTIAAAIPAVGCLFNLPMLTGRWWREPGVLPRSSCRVTDCGWPEVRTIQRLGVLLRRADVDQVASLSGSPAASRKAGTAASWEPPRHIAASPDSRRAGDRSASATLRPTP